MENKINRQRLYLHILFVLIILANQSVFSAMYAKNYHFNWAVDFQPMLVLFYLFIISYTYFIAFVVLTLKPIWLRVLAILVTFLLFPPLRFLVDQRISEWLFGVTNYAKDQTFGFIFHDNLFFSFIVLLIGVFLKFMDDWFIHDRIKATLEQQNIITHEYIRLFYCG